MRIALGLAAALSVILGRYSKGAYLALHLFRTYVPSQFVAFLGLSALSLLELSSISVSVDFKTTESPPISNFSSSPVCFSSTVLPYFVNINTAYLISTRHCTSTSHQVYILFLISSLAPHHYISISRALLALSRPGVVPSYLSSFATSTDARHLGAATPGCGAGH